MQFPNEMLFINENMPSLACLSYAYFVGYIAFAINDYAVETYTY